MLAATEVISQQRRTWENHMPRGIQDGGHQPLSLMDGQLRKVSALARKASSYWENKYYAWRVWRGTIEPNFTAKTYSEGTCPAATLKIVTKLSILPFHLLNNRVLIWLRVTLFE